MNKQQVLEKLEKSKSLAWFQKYEIFPGSGIYTPGSSPRNYNNEFKRLGLDAAGFAGKRVLDIGAATGALSFYLEDCGATVVAVDPDDPETNGFNIVHEIRNSSVTHRRISVYDLCPEQLGYFDAVFFFGVFYHLQHPLLAFQRINSVCKPGALLIGGGTSGDRWIISNDDDWSKGADLESVGKRKFRNKHVMNIDSLNDLGLTAFSSKPYLKDPTIWFLPNRTCVKEWLAASGFDTDQMVTSVTPLFKFYDERGKDQISSTLAYKLRGRLRRMFGKVRQLERYRSTLTFIARYASPPVPEWPGSDMLQYQIPTRYECAQLKEENARLRAELKKARQVSVSEPSVPMTVD